MSYQFNFNGYLPSNSLLITLVNYPLIQCYNSKEQKYVDILENCIEPIIKFFRHS